MPFLDYRKIPPHTRHGLGRYLAFGLRPGDFIYSVLTNNLRGACMHADDENLDAIYLTVAFLHLRFPAMAWGSVASVKGWMGLPQEERDRILKTAVDDSTLKLVGVGDSV